MREREREKTSNIRYDNMHIIFLPKKTLNYCGVCHIYTHAQNDIQKIPCQCIYTPFQCTFFSKSEKMLSTIVSYILRKCNVICHPRDGSQLKKYNPFILSSFHHPYSLRTFSNNFIKIAGK